ncbi:MAG: hypothetical protein K9G76_02535 [Bacteroidales bacterium]|nr:hypothetical protein [Bacteroidales bacterium]MCF8404177.1 hypothetical protein [Bacteroidales bacterium]
MNFGLSGEKQVQTDKKSDQQLSVKKQKTEVKKERGSFLKINIDMESQFYQVNLLKLFLKWKFHLAVIVLIAAGLAAIFSGKSFITPKFKSFAIVYPSNIAPYSDENETEQMLQILQSRDISDQVIEKFNLPKHYEISRDDPYYHTYMMDEYWTNVSVTKTPNEAVNIQVMDSDPDTACNMVNAMIELYDFKVRSLHEEKFGEVVQMFERALLKKQTYLDSINARLTFLATEYGLLDYEAQSEQITKGFLKTIDGTGGAYVKDKEVKQLKNNIEAKGGEMLILLNLIEQETIKYSDLKDEYEKAYMDYDRRFSYSSIITKPFPADKKAYPVRWLIMLIASLASFFVAFIVILILENYHEMAKKSIA